VYAKCITLYLKLDQWNKVALKQKEVLALYLFLLSHQVYFHKPWYFYQPRSSTATIKCDFSFSFPTDLSCPFSPPLFLIFVHAFVHTNK